MELMRIRTIVDTIYEEGFRQLPAPLYKVAVGAVIRNPYSRRYVEDLDELYEAGRSWANCWERQQSRK